eukprot:m.115618 g.115618  ORF g.115618 m.115618 type:complete len:161 (+) comp12842_c1_seq19:132-614(+)
MLILRFANRVLYPLWNASNVKSISISLKSKEANDGQFFLKNALQTHLLQLMTFFAMEQPQSQDIWAIKDAKNKCLRCVQPASPEATVLATHEDGGSEPTFVQTVLKINSDRWEGVPFIIKCGEGLNENKLEVCLYMSMCVYLYERVSVMSSFFLVPESIR